MVRHIVCSTLHMNGWRMALACRIARDLIRGIQVPEYFLNHYPTPTIG